MRPCPCGFHGTWTSDCRCDDATVARYVAKLSGPLLDRIDLHVEVTRVPFDDIVSRSASESSPTIRARVARARALQRERYRGARDLRLRWQSESNAEMRLRAAWSLRITLLDKKAAGRAVALL
jgi:magnesium chelatase family protein